MFNSFKNCQRQELARGEKERERGYREAKYKKKGKQCKRYKKREERDIVDVRIFLGKVPRRSSLGTETPHSLSFIQELRKLTSHLLVALVY